MKPAPHRERIGTSSLLRSIALSLLLSLLCAATGWAQDDPPGRVGRLADLNGSVSWWDHEAGQWADADRNLPLTSGDRIATAANSRAELRVGTTVLRLAAGSELEVLRLDDERLSFQLHTGSLALRVRSREVAAEIELVTAEARLRPQTAGHYRLDRTDDDTWAASWRGELRIDDPAGFTLVANQRVRLQRDGRSGVLRFALLPLQDDAFAQWVTRDDQRDERTASSRYVSPEMTGAEDLDRSGRWEQHPEYGAVWVPVDVAADWAPYRNGRWAWVRPWGWTWVDDARWGFAPFHYGRWAYWRDRWCWAPGAYVARPVFAPALVAWVGGGGAGWSASLQFGGGGPVGWVPLAPREAYAPHYRVSPRYVERINVPPPYRWQQPPGQRPSGPVMYGNQGIPGAVTVVPRDVLLRREPVGRAVIELRDGRWGRGDRGDPGPDNRRGPEPPQALLTPAAELTPVAPPPAPVGVQPAQPGQGRGREFPRPPDGGGRGVDPRPRWQQPAPANPLPGATPVPAPAAPVVAPPAPVRGPVAPVPPPAALPAAPPAVVPPAQPLGPPATRPGAAPAAPGAAQPPAGPAMDRDAGQPWQRRREWPDAAGDPGTRRDRQRPPAAGAQPAPPPAAVPAPAASPQPPAPAAAPSPVPAPNQPRQQPPSASPQPQRPAAPPAAAPTPAPASPAPTPAPAPTAAPKPVAPPPAAAPPRAEGGERRGDDRKHRPESPTQRDRETAR